MQLLEAMDKAKNINDGQSLVNASVSKSVYGGYSVNTEPIELTILKNSLSMLVTKNKAFVDNVGAKYGK